MPYWNKLTSLCAPPRGRIITSMGHIMSSVVITLAPPEELLTQEGELNWDNWEMIFEKRAAHIPQGGEVCLPGGKIEPWETSQEAALREWEEETGIDQCNLQVLGCFGTLVHAAARQIDVWLTLSPRLTTMEPKLNDEVDTLFSLTLGQLMDAPWKSYLLDQTIQISPLSPPVPFEQYKLKDYRRGSWSNRTFPVWFVEELPELLWGMTAVIVRAFLVQVYGRDPGISS